MENFRYVRPGSIEEACRLLREHGERARPLAGGQSLLILMKSGVVRPEVVISLRGLAGLRAIREADGGLALGATAIHASVAASSLVRARAPLLAEAAAQIGSPAIRQMGTIGGSLSQADPAADLPPALLCLDARLAVAKAGAIRELPVAEFLRGYYETAMDPDELLTEVRLPALAGGSGSAFLKLRRQATDMATVCVAALVVLDAQGVCREARIGVGAASAAAYRATEAEVVLRGTRLGAAELEEAGRLAQQRAEPATDHRGGAEYKRAMVRVLTARALAQATERARGTGR
ncbi:MAG: xanthine dehydrogenase family protein subunit M [Deltaproteobacteria bacterium]|nr:xanthine dehydrogenase family protein subunit M [Deltaproteobacteria bacterium]